MSEELEATQYLTFVLAEEVFAVDDRRLSARRSFRKTCINLKP